MEGAQSQTRSPWTMFALLTVVVLLVIFGIYIVWSASAARDNAQSRALAEARVLNTEAAAAWDYVSSIEDRVNYTHGVYDFKGVYCTVAAKDIARRFSQNSDYSIRYVRESPRNLADTPDEFESRALAAFAQGASEYYEHVDAGQADGGTFRYASALLIAGSCLKCHGDPAGEADPVGYLKEGMKLGDLAGAVSIEIPMAGLKGQAYGATLRAGALFVALVVGLALVGLWGTRHFVSRPLAQTNARLKDETEAQSNFLTIMSHELKTPIASIIAFTDLWRRKETDRPADEARLVEEVQTNSKMLLEMVDNVLDAARMEAGAMRVEPGVVDIVDVASLVRSTMGPIAQVKGVDLAIEADPGVPVVRTDGEALRRITVNLVNNALRYTPAGGSVRLSFSYARGRLRVEVADTGVGIPAERLPHVFDRFVSTEGSAQTSEGGSGLGLYIVRGFAERMGGWARVSSESGHGSTFTVEVPAPACEGEGDLVDGAFDDESEEGGDGR